RKAIQRGRVNPASPAQHVRVLALSGAPHLPKTWARCQGFPAPGRPDQSLGPLSTRGPGGPVNDLPRRSVTGGEVQGASAGGPSYSPLSARDGAGLFSARP